MFVKLVSKSYAGASPVFHKARLGRVKIEFPYITVNKRSCSGCMIAVHKNSLFVIFSILFVEENWYFFGLTDNFPADFFQQCRCWWACRDLPRQTALSRIRQLVLWIDFTKKASRWSSEGFHFIWIKFHTGHLPGGQFHRTISPSQTNLPRTVPQQICILTRYYRPNFDFFYTCLMKRLTLLASKYFYFYVPRGFLGQAVRWRTLCNGNFRKREVIRDGIVWARKRLHLGMPNTVLFDEKN